MRVELQLLRSSRLNTFKMIFRVKLEKADATKDDLKEFEFVVAPRGCVFQDPPPRDGHLLFFGLKDMRTVVRKKRRHYTFTGTGVCNGDPVSVEILTLFRRNYIGTTRAEISPSE